MAILPGTDIELGKWYPAEIPPPDLRDEATHEYSLILAIKSIGPIPGFYFKGENQYYWHCERYDSFDDEPVPGWTREQEINNNLDWVYEKARGVISWLIIPGYDDEIDSIDGKTGFDRDPDQNWTIRKDEEDEDDLGDDEPGSDLPIGPLHLN